MIRLLVPEELRPLLRVRGGARASGLVALDVAKDPTASVGHAVQAVGVPLTEVGGIRVGPADIALTDRLGHLSADSLLELLPRPRPQPLDGPPRLLLDVHLGTLARRLRLLGVDAAYGNEATDDELVAQAAAEDRLLLTQDRGLLMRRGLRRAAYVRGGRPDDQLADVLDRFRLPLHPFSRCTACNGVLLAVPKSDVLDVLEPGTRRTQDDFARCDRCGRVYWHGAHGRRLRALVERWGPQPTLE